MEVAEGNTSINGTVCATGDIMVVGTNSISINNSFDTYPALLTKSNIYFNGVNPSNPNRPYIEGIIFANQNIYIDNLNLLGSVYGNNIYISGNLNFQYNTAAASNPYLNVPPYFQTAAAGISILKWRDSP